MKMLRLAGVFAGLAVAGIGGVAQAAAPGFSTANVNIRTGPDTQFPSLGVIPDGSPIQIEGCLQDESWCDVEWNGFRGWVYSEYVGYELPARPEAPLVERRVEVLPDVGLAAIGVPIVAFAAADYWNRNYVNRPYYAAQPWYADRYRWEGYAPPPRPGWRPPPPGPRPPGWWRDNYVPPPNMPPPPPPGAWHRPPPPPMPPPGPGGIHVAPVIGPGGPDRHGQFGIPNVNPGAPGMPVVGPGGPGTPVVGPGGPGRPVGPGGPGGPGTPVVGPGGPGTPVVGPGGPGRPVGPGGPGTPVVGPGGPGTPVVGPG
ncbi:SH3 domain-containing protein, partial [Xanthobacter sp. V4C-4]|uniref:SH3 domain-containing protein n=1 Tax=Xanthobacter cornucopiae TaxID=3119924 RepID=UPI0037277C94